jgi:hypothetical protein
MKVARLSAVRTGHLDPQETFLVLIYVRGRFDPRAIVRLEGLYNEKFWLHRESIPRSSRHRVPQFTRYWLPNVGSPMLGSSNLPIIDENRCSRICVNKTEGPKILPMKHSKCLRLHLIQNWAINKLSKIAHLQWLMSHSLAINKNFTVYQNKDTHSVPNSWATDHLYCDY